MRLIENLKELSRPYPNAVITIGNFDGVHIGHQALFHEVIERADALGGTSVAITFEPHPIRVLKKNGNPPLITLYEQKLELMESTGLDVIISIPFTVEFAALTARQFVEDLLVKQIGAKVIVVGRDYTFGKDRAGNVALLQTLGKELGFEVVTVGWIPNAPNRSDRISSTRIRDLVMAGDVAEAQRMLGRHYQIRGEVIRGRDRGGKLLGFPTANITLQDELCPKTGVYAVTVEWRGQKFKGVANIGYSPTFDDHVFTVEVHVLDFNENLYGEKIRVNFIHRLRDEEKFSDIDKLARQIRNDADRAREILSL
jgi:riboflavin kinase / FMN adenylyltransferase